MSEALWGWTWLPRKAAAISKSSEKLVTRSRGRGIMGFLSFLIYTQLFVREEENNWAHHPEMKPDLDLTRDPNRIRIESQNESLET